MKTISIPLTDEINEFIEEQIKLGIVTSKAEFVRNALVRYKDNEFTALVLKSKEETSDGGALVGNLDTLVQKFSSK